MGIDLRCAQGERKVCRGARSVNAAERRPQAPSTLWGGREARAGGDRFGDRGGEFVDPRARHDDGVAPAVRFLGDAEEFPAFVFADLELEKLPLDLQLLRFDEVFHGQRGSKLSELAAGMEGKSCVEIFRKPLDQSSFCGKARHSIGDGGGAGPCVDQLRLERFRYVKRMSGLREG